MIFGVALNVYKLHCVLLVFQPFLFFELYFKNISMYVYLVHMIVTFKDTMAFHCANSPI